MWEESWDDDDTNEDFSKQLKYAPLRILSVIAMGTDVGIERNWIKSRRRSRPGMFVIAGVSELFGATGIYVYYASITSKLEKISFLRIRCDAHDLCHPLSLTR